jgi:lysozyme
MNWYKKAQQKNRLLELLKGLSMGTVIGLVAWLGFNTFADLKNNYMQSPQVIEQKIIEYQDANNNQQIETSQPSNNFNYNEVAKMIERHEGKRNEVYLDTKGIPTIGIGFNLNRNDAKNKIESLGLNYNNVRNGSQSLTDQQIYSLFKDTLNEAINTAQSFVPNFNEHPANVQGVIINMAFNLGPNKLAGFKDFREALLNKDYSTAANEMIDSEWYGQVGDRSKELVDIMKRI